MEGQRPKQEKAAPKPPPALPATAPSSLFSRILKLKIEWRAVSREFQKIILELVVDQFQKLDNLNTDGCTNVAGLRGRRVFGRRRESRADQRHQPFAHFARARANHLPVFVL
jgi:hypothetical protein